MNELQLTRYKDQEIKELKAENAQLRKRLGESNRHARRVERAYRDALLLAEWRSVAVFPSRRYAAHHKISQRRWQNAIALLRMARILEGRRWTTTTLATIEQRLDAAKQRATDTPDAFKARLPRHGRR